MILGLNALVFWLILTAILLVIEAATTNLVSIWFAAGTFCALISDLCGADITAQVIIAIAISIISLTLIIILKPFDKWKKRQTEATNSDRVIGKQAVVIKAIDSLSGTGLVKVMGQIWSAASIDGENIAEGEYVIIKNISGVKLIVDKE